MTRRCGLGQLRWSVGEARELTAGGAGERGLRHLMEWTRAGRGVMFDVRLTWPTPDVDIEEGENWWTNYGRVFYL